MDDCKKTLIMGRLDDFDRFQKRTLQINRLKKSNSSDVLQGGGK